MAKPIKNKDGNKKTISKNVKKPAVAAAQQQFWGLEKFLEKHQKEVIAVFLFISLLFSLFLFDVRISEGGDDSGYIQRAWDIIKNNSFPFYQGPVYPIVLAIPTYFFGINLIILKLTSVIFSLGTLWFTYLAFRKRIPYLVLFSLIFFLSVNSFIQYFSSQTYNESFFLFLQAFVLYLVFKLIDSVTETNINHKEKTKYVKVFWIGFWFMLLSLSKDVAIVCVIPVILFFLFDRKYKYGLFVFISFLVWRISTDVVIKMFYKGESGHIQQMLLKNYYKPELGYETVTGLINRYFSDIGSFLSVSVLKICHFRESASSQPIIFLAIVIALSLIAVAIFSYKNNRYIFFTVVYVIVLFSGVCVGMPTVLAQDRHILLVIPYIYLLLIYGLYELTLKSSVLRFYFFCFIVVFIAINLFNSIEDSTKNFKILRKNIKGDVYYGFTEDWVNYLRLSAYCADSLPPSSVVASRKAPMSFIYAKGKEFYPVWVVFSNNPDTILAKFKQDKVNYIILASLRQNPKMNNGMIINTMQRLLYPIMQKYPQKVSFIKQMGDSEPAYLYKFNY